MKEDIEKYVIEIYNILKKDISVLSCDDCQCDNEDCVLYKAVNQYIKYQIKK